MESADGFKTVTGSNPEMEMKHLVDGYERSLREGHRLASSSKPADRVLRVLCQYYKLNKDPKALKDIFNLCNVSSFVFLQFVTTELNR